MTLIAGLNGTSKSTLLGMICQPIGFPTTDKKSIYTDAYKDVSLKERRTLFETLFKSSISDVFRFSKVHDKPRQHDYVVRLDADPGLLSTEIVESGLSVRSEARGGGENDKIRIVTNEEIHSLKMSKCVKQNTRLGLFQGKIMGNGGALVLKYLTYGVKNIRRIVANFVNGFWLHCSLCEGRRLQR